MINGKKQAHLAYWLNTVNIKNRFHLFALSFFFCTLTDDCHCYSLQSDTSIIIFEGFCFGFRLLKSCTVVILLLSLIKTPSRILGTESSIFKTSNVELLRQLHHLLHCGSLHAPPVCEVSLQEMWSSLRPSQVYGCIVYKLGTLVLKLLLN